MSETEMTGETSHDLAHPVPFRVLATMIVLLLGLTWLTVAATWVDLGTLNIWVALVIAVVKALLVALYFMHLRYENLFHAVILVCALLFVITFVGIALMDSTAYHVDVFPYPATAISP